MIEWKRYGQTRETQPPSHETCLVSNGKFAKTAVHELDDDGVYRWYDREGYRISDVTHYVVINLPKVGEKHA